MPNLLFTNAGSRSEFFTVSENVGFKTFESKQDAEYAHNIQTELAKYNFAPKVLSRVKRMRHRGELTGWGFETEVAEMLGCGGNDCGCGECDDLYDRYSNRIASLCDRIENKTGLSFVDNHIGNVGIIIRRGYRRLVCIDTGKESVSDGSDDGGISCSCTVCRRIEAR